MSESNLNLPPPPERPQQAPEKLSPASSQSPFASGVDGLEIRLREPSAPSVPRGSMRNKILLGFFIIVGFFLIVGAAAGYFIINDPPAQVVKMSLERLNSVSSLHSKWVVNITISNSASSAPLSIGEPERSTQLEKFMLAVKADIDQAKRGTPEAESQVKVDVSAQTGSGGLSFSATGAGELRTFGLKKIYGQVTSLPIPTETFGPEVEQIKQLIDPYINKWIKIDSNDFQSVFGLAQQETPDQLFTSEEQQRLIDKLSRTIDLKRVTSEKIGDDATFHYRAEFARPGLDDFLFELFTILSQKEVLGAGAMLEPSDDPVQIKNDITKGLDEFFRDNSLSAEIWVGRWDLMPRKAAFNFEARSEGQMVATINASVLFSKFNEPVTIQEPTDALDFKAILEQITGINVNDAMSTGRDARRQADLTTLASALELYKDSKGSYPSTNNLLSRMDSSNIPCREFIAGDFLSRCPSDPTGLPSFYGYKSDGSSYELTAVLENLNDPNCVVEGTICIFRIYNRR